MKKRIFVFLITLVFIFSLTACGSSDDGSKKENDKNTESRTDKDDKGSDNSDSGSDAPLIRRDDDTPAPTKAPIVPDNDDDGPGDAQGISTAAGLTLNNLLAYAETGSTEFFTPHRLTSAEEAALRSSVEAEGGTLKVDSDGTIRITGNGKSSLVISPDGAVSGTDEDGQSFGIPAGLNSKDWPTSAFGNAIPKADFDIGMQFEDEESLMIMFNNVSYDDAKAYGKQLASAGFTIDANEIDMRDTGFYGYSAHNADNIDVEFNYMSSGSTGASCSITVEQYEEYSYPGYDDPYYTDPGFNPFGNTGFDDDYGYGDDYDPYGGSYNHYGDSYDPYGYGAVTRTPDFDWDSSPYTKMIPEPLFGDGFCLTEDAEDAMIINVIGATEEDFKPYVKLLKGAGYTYDSDSEEYDGIMFFTGKNKDGYEVIVQYTYGGFDIGITKEP